MNVRPDISGEALSPFGVAALEYAERGWHVFPCSPATKVPHHGLPKLPKGEGGYKPATADVSQVTEWWRRWPDANIGLHLEASGLVAIDADTYKPESGWAAFAESITVPHTLVQRSARGGMHYLFQAAPGARHKGRLKDCGGVDVKHDGYILLEPSTVNGGQYRFETDDDPAAAPDWVPEKDRVSADDTEWAGVEGRVDLTDDEIRDALAFIDRDRWVKVGMAISHQYGGDAAGFEIFDTWSAGGVKYNAAEMQRLWALLKRGGRVRPITFKSVLTEAQENGFVNPRSRSKPAWLKRCQQDDKGLPVPNLANAMIALREDPLVRDAFEYDEMVLHANVVGAIPGIEFDEARPIKDHDVSAVQEWLQLSGLQRIGKDTTHQAVDMRAVERNPHPVREYLEGICWDGHHRVENWLNRYLGAEVGEYHTGIGMMFLVGMAARIMRPGCKMDYMPILEGPQGVRKSTACAILGGAWFSDNLPDVTAGKDVVQHLTGKWLIEIAELSAMNKAEAASLKAFVTRPVERYRPPYGRKEVIQPRQCVFIGTTNKSRYLRDETGGRQFWPVKVGAIDTDALQRDRDQLFAGAVQMFTRGVQWWSDGEFERRHIQPQQEDRFEADAWEDCIRAWAQEGLIERATLSEIAAGALYLQRERLGTADQNRIRAILERMGWEQKPRTAGNRFWGPRS